MPRMPILHFLYLERNVKIQLLSHSLKSGPAIRQDCCKQKVGRQ